MNDPRDPTIDDDLDELVSAYLDGEATSDERARVDSDPELRARVEDLRALTSSWTVPLDGPSEAEREQIIAAALGAAAHRGATAPVPLTVARARRARWRRPAAVAASVVALATLAAGAVSTLGRDGGGSEELATTAAADREVNAGDAARNLDQRSFQPESVESLAQPSAETATRSGAGAEALPPDHDLGTFADVDSLFAAARLAPPSPPAPVAAPASDAPACPETPGVRLGRALLGNREVIVIAVGDELTALDAGSCSPLASRSP